MSDAKYQGLDVPIDSSSVDLPSTATTSQENVGMMSEKPSHSFGQCHKWWIIGAVIAVVVILGVVLGTVFGLRSRYGETGEGSGSNSATPEPSGMLTDIPNGNMTLSQILGDINYDSSAQANANVPPLSQSFPYGQKPIRGVNLGGWLVLEPYIKPSLFEPYNSGVVNSNAIVVDEWTLCAALGPTQANETMINHYKTWVTEDTFKTLQQAGIDHVRIPIGYWAVQTYEGDPYVPQISLLYFLQALEWARKYGIRVNIDVHALPGSQNGWNHSGRAGVIGWLNGTDGDLNAYNRSQPILETLAQVASAPRYRDVVTMFGLVNEPNMMVLDANRVEAWTEAAYGWVRSNNYTGQIIFGDGFKGLTAWTGFMQPPDYQNVIVDLHNYQIFDRNQLSTTHYTKVVINCNGTRSYVDNSMNRSPGFGPTLIGEWSVAETDCALYLNGVGIGARYDGTLNDNLPPTCPNCTCTGLNDTSQWSSEYRSYLTDYMQSQIDTYETSFGWFFWNFKTENQPHWSYLDLMEERVAPSYATNLSFTCANNLSSVPQNLLQ